jgi:predicted O-methyltransferase YrrM
MPRPPAYRADFGPRNHTLFGALGLRPAVAQHSGAEAALLQRHAHGARLVVEIGVAEGGSAWDMRSVMDPGGTLVLIDTYPKVAGVNLSVLTARRLLRGVPRGRLEWIRARSDEAAVGWTRPIDFLLIDGDHDYGPVRRDWEDWSPHVVPGGKVAFHDALPGAAWVDDSFGSARFVGQLLATPPPGWSLVDRADSMAVFRRS